MSSSAEALSKEQDKFAKKKYLAETEYGLKYDFLKSKILELSGSSKKEAFFQAAIFMGFLLYDEYCLKLYYLLLLENIGKIDLKNKKVRLYYCSFALKKIADKIKSFKLKIAKKDLDNFLLEGYKILLLDNNIKLDRQQLAAELVEAMAILAEHNAFKKAK